MKKITIVLTILLSGMVSAQTFDFECNQGSMAQLAVDDSAETISATYLGNAGYYVTGTGFINIGVLYVENGPVVTNVVANNKVPSNIIQAYSLSGVHMKFSKLLSPNPAFSGSAYSAQVYVPPSISITEGSWNFKFTFEDNSTKNIPVVWSKE